MAEASAVRAGRAYVELLLENKSFLQGLDRSFDHLRDFGRGMSVLGSIMFKAGAAILTPITAAVAHFTKASSALEDMSQRTGIAASKLAELGYAAEMTDANLEGVEQAIKKMLQQLHKLRDGEKGARSLFRELNLGAADFAGKTPDEQFALIAARLNDVHDAAKRVSLAQEIFGKSGPNLLPMMKELETLRREAQREGLIPTDEAVQAGDAIGDAMDKIKKTTSAAVFELGSAFAPAVLESLGAVRQVVRAGKNWIQQNHDLLRSVGRLGVWLMLAGGAFFAAGRGIIFLGNTLQHTAKLAGMAGTLLRVPLRVLGLLRGVLSPLTSAIGALHAAGMKAFTALADSATDMSKRLVAAAKAGLSSLGVLAASAGRAAARVARSAIGIGATLARTLAAGARSGVTAAVQTLAGLQPILAAVPSWFAKGFRGAVRAAQGFALGLRQALIPAVGGIRDAAYDVGYTLRYTFTRPLDYIQALAPRATAALVRGFGTARVAGLQAAVAVAAAWSQAGSAVVNRAQQIGRSITARFSAAGRSAGNGLTSALKQSAAVVQDIWTNIYAPIAKRLITRLTPAWQAVANLAGRAAGSARAVWLPIAGAIRATLGRVAPLVNQDLAKIRRGAAQVARGVVAVFRAVGPPIAAAIVRGVRNGLARVQGLARAAAGGMRRTLAAGMAGVGRGLSGALSGIGALAGLAGPMLGQFGEFLSMAPLVISSIAAIGGGLLSLVSPFGLIAAAIAGGVFAWTQFSETGQKVLQQVMGFVAPIVDTFRDTFQGIRDAIAGGDLALAGRIAMAGLRVAFLQGLTALGKALGGTWGGVVGKLGAQLAGGDFRGAWETAITAMATLWDQFVAGIVGAFSNAARAITDTWQKTVTGIANWILEDAANGGVMGRAAMIGTGIDVEKEMQRDGMLNAERRKSLQADLAKWQALLQEAEASNGSVQVGQDGETFTSDDLRRLIKDRQEALGIAVPDFLATGRQSIDQQVGGTADSIRDWLDKQEQSTNDAAAESMGDLGRKSAGGMEFATEGLEEAQRELDELRRQAAEAAARAKAETAQEREDAFGGIETDPAANKQEVFTTFSAAALQAQGGGASPMDKIAAYTMSARDTLYLMQNEAKKLNRMVEEGIVLGS